MFRLFSRNATRFRQQLRTNDNSFHNSFLLLLPRLASYTTASSSSNSSPNDSTPPVANTQPTTSNNNNSSSNNNNNNKSNNNNNNSNSKSSHEETERMNAQRRADAREYFWRVQRERNQAVAFKVGAVVLLTLGLSYAFVPLYQAFCQATGYGGTTQSGKKSSEVLSAPETTKKAKPMTIYFNADTSQSLQWKFEPSQRSVQCNTGESVLAFFR